MVTVWEAVFHMSGAIVKTKQIKAMFIRIVHNFWKHGKDSTNCYTEVNKKQFPPTYIPHFINSLSPACQTVWQAGLNE